MILKKQNGQGLIEYLILVAIIAIGTMSIIKSVGKNVSVGFANVAKSLGSGNDDHPIHADELNREQYSKKDMTDFMKGTR